MHELSADTADEPWPTWKRVGFRLLLVYFVLFTLPFPLDQIPVIGTWIGYAVQAATYALANLVAFVVLGIKSPLYAGGNGSGDLPVHFITLAIHLTLALTIALIWSLVDRRPRDYARAAVWLERACCLYSSVYMIQYGAVKLIPVQMPPPDLTTLTSPLGDLNRMHLVWTLMGVSPGYQSLVGATELLGGLLLVFRRTRLLGATLMMVVMTNVVLLNFFYDIPVKLFSTQLWLIAVGLMVLDASRLLAVFVRNQPTPAAEIRPLFASPRANRFAFALKLGFVAIVLSTHLAYAYSAHQTYGRGREHHALRGVYEVESFECEGVELAPLTTDTSRWQLLIIDQPETIDVGEYTLPGSIVIERMDGSRDHHTIELDDGSWTAPVGTLTYTLDGDRLELRGIWDGAALVVRLRARVPPGRRLLSF